MKYDVFISYSSQDRAVVESLCSYLEENRIRCFVAYRDIPRGVVWARAVVEALDQSRMVVVVFSDNLNQSEQVDREIELASEDHKPILTFRITNDQFKGAKKYYLKNINWIDGFPNPELAFGNVAQNVRRLLNTRSTSAMRRSHKVNVIPAIDNERIYNVGDLYDEGGKRGVVFEVSEDGKHGKIVSLDQSPRLAWCTREQYDRGVEVGASSPTSGRLNTQKILSRGDSDHYLAAVWCRAKGDDWYLPSIAELTKFTLYESVRDAVNATLRREHATPIFEEGMAAWYWSSTEYEKYTPDQCVWYVNMFYSYTNGSYKYAESFVRAISMF